jgi:membrane protein
MSASNMHQHSVADAPGSAAPPSWVILVSSALLAIGMAWRTSAAPTAARHHVSMHHTAQHTRLQNGRGRCATPPHEISWSGWEDILLRIYRRITRDRILLIGAGVTFYLILAIFPAISALVLIYGLFFDPETMAGHVNLVAGVAPGGAIDILREQLTRLGQQSGAALGVSFFVSLAIALWSATSGVKAIFDGLNVAYEEEEKRSFVKLTGLALVFTIGLIGFVLLLLAGVVALPVALNYFPLRGMTDILLKIVRWPLLFVIVAFGLSVFYQYGPNRAKPQWRWISWGSAAATGLWLVASILFSWYVSNFGSYNKTYGSLGAMVGFMTWVWLSNVVVLVGAQLNSETEHQAVRQSTAGPPRPLEARGAKTADTIGAPAGAGEPGASR